MSSLDAVKMLTLFSGVVVVVVVIVVAVVAFQEGFCNSLPPTINVSEVWAMDIARLSFPI